jgi:hypothetical protein
VNDTVNYSVLTDNQIRNYTNSASDPIVVAPTKFHFYPCCLQNQNGVIQGAFLYYDGMSTLGQPVWSKFRTLINQTLLSRLTNAGNRRILICGQSNASVVRQADWVLFSFALPRLTFSRISEAEAVQTNGFGLELWEAR